MSFANGHPPGGPPVVASIQIVMLANGEIGCKAEVPSRPVFNLMIETARQNMVAQLMAQEQAAQQQKVIHPPAGLNLPGLRG